MLTRLPDWDVRLYRFLQEVSHTPYSEGTHDCAMFCAAVIYAITGVDLGADYRGTYSSKEEYTSILEANGGLEGIVTRYLGPPGPPLTARRGDIVLAQWRELQSIGVCLGPNIAFSTSRGLDTTYSRRDAIKAWRVG